jgi:diaminopimelate decarboxylase
VQLPPLAVGDHLVITPVGAYNTTQSMQFIEYRPATVLIHGDREVSIIREAEDLSVVCAQERLPAHLETSTPEPFGRVLPLRATAS